MKDVVRTVEGKDPVTRCPYCHEGCGASEATACPSCSAPHHTECWDACGGCASCAIGARERGPGAAVQAPLPIGSPVAIGQAPPRPSPGPPPLTLDLARELLVRAGYGLGQIDDVLGRAREAGSSTPGAGGAVLTAVSILAGALAAFLWAWRLNGWHDPALVPIAVACTAACALALLGSRRR